MAHFYGWVQGQRGQASRLGGRSSGLATYAASWTGAVAVTLYVRDDGTDCAQIALRQHHGRGTDAVLYDGPVNPLQDGGGDALGWAAAQCATLADRCAEPVTEGGQ